MGHVMKVKLLKGAGEITEGAMVEVTSTAGTNDDRTDEDVGGSSNVVAPVYTVTDDEGHVEEVDTRDLQVMPKEAGGRAPRRIRARKAK
jgi:hypothetical protein